MKGVNWKRYVDGRFKEQAKAAEALRKEQAKALKAALKAANKANKKLDIETKRWQESSNEWRGAMTDRERNFLTRKEFYAILGTAAAVWGAFVAAAHIHP